MDMAATVSGCWETQAVASGRLLAQAGGPGRLCGCGGFQNVRPCPVLAEGYFAMIHTTSPWSADTLCRLDHTGRPALASFLKGISFSEREPIPPSPPRSVGKLYGTEKAVGSLF